MEVKCAYNKLNDDLKECCDILDHMSLDNICHHNARMDEFLKDVDEFLNDMDSLETFPWKE